MNLVYPCVIVEWFEGETVIKNRKITSTNNLIRIITEEKAVINNVSCYQVFYNYVNVFPVSDCKFVKNLISLSSNLFVESLNWEYERVNDSTFGEFMIFCNCGKMKYGKEYYAHMRINGDVSIDEVEKMLSIKNESEEWFIMSNTCKKNFMVFNQKMAGYLMQKGFVLIDMRPDLKNTRRNVFLFNDTPQLKSAIDEYMSR